MTMAGGRISINFKDSEKSDIDGTYSYYTIRKSGFYADLVYKLTGNSEAVSDQIMRVDKAIRVDPPKSQNKSTSKNTSSKSTVTTQTTEWKITVDGESIELRDLKNDEADPLNFKMIY